MDSLDPDRIVAKSRTQTDTADTEGLRTTSCVSETVVSTLVSSRQHSLENYDLLRIIGEGCTSSVRIVQAKDTGTLSALKVMSKQLLLSRKCIKRVLQEKAILSKVQHWNIVKLRHSFQDPRNLYLVLEYAPGGELYSLIRKAGRLLPSVTHFYVTELTYVLVYLHSQEVVYRDLKPENVLLAASGHIKLTDFGFAKVLKEGESTYSFCGTPEYLAPEVITRAGHSRECDWWTFGVLLYEMLTGTTPFDAPEPMTLYTNIVTKSFTQPKDVDSVTASFLSALLNKVPSQRLSDSSVQQHPYFAGVDWATLEQLTPPHVPILRNGLDTSHFDQYSEPNEVAPDAVIDDSVFAAF